MKSDPNKLDTEGDGIGDKLDNRPFIKGYYSEKVGDVVIGRMTIVSSMYNALAGHSFLVYKSYVNDTLDFTGINGGYILDTYGLTYYNVGPSLYNVTPGECVSIGNTSITMEAMIPQPFEGSDIDTAGIFFNREFATEIDHKKKGEYEQRFIFNMSESREITEAQLERVITQHNLLNYYNLSNNNCCVVATKAWNIGFYGSDTFSYDFKQLKAYNDMWFSDEMYDWYISTPIELYYVILNKFNGSEFDLRLAIGIR